MFRRVKNVQLKTHTRARARARTHARTYSQTLRKTIYLPNTCHINVTYNVIASDVFLAPFFHSKWHVGRHVFCCSWRFIIFYFGICERMLLFGKQQRLAGTYGKCWTTDLRMRIQGTCVKWRGGEGHVLLHCMTGSCHRLHPKYSVQISFITGGFIARV
jgi:hypothetical protein